MSMMSMDADHPCSTVIGSVSRFLMVLTEKTQNLGIDLSGKEIDHVCYRCSTTAEYQQVCKDLLPFGVILLESMIGGRPIAMVSLSDSIRYREWSVRCIEVTCPKPGKTHQQGLEHAEVVVGSLADGIHNSKPLLLAFTKQHPDVQFDEKAINKETNADVSISLLKGMSIKFHARPVYEVIAEELKAGQVEAIPADYFTNMQSQPLVPPSPPTSATPPLPSRLTGTLATMSFPPPAAADKDIAGLLSDAVAMKHLTAMANLRGGGWSEGDAAERRVRQTTEFLAGNSLNGAIYLPPSGAAGTEGVEGETPVFAGIGGFRSIDWWNRSAEMGVILTPTCWRQGISAEVHLLCFTVAFEELCLNRIEFKTASSNTPMRQFLTQVLGANHDGTLRDAFPVYKTTDIFKLYENAELYSVLACEWPNLKKRLQSKLQSRK